MTAVVTMQGYDMMLAEGLNGHAPAIQPPSALVIDV